MPSAVLSPQQNLADFLRPLATSSSFETGHQVDAHYFIQKSPWQKVSAGDRVDAEFWLESGVVCMQVPDVILMTVTTANCVLLFLLDR
jgi:hypothetical protein